MSLLVSARHVWGKDNDTNSILIENGRIKSIGSRENLAMLADKVVDYPHNLILPGFCDAHLHLAWLGENLTGCDLRGCTSIEDFAGRLQAWAKNLKPDEVLYGFGWDERTWSKPQNITGEMLDDIVPGVKVFLTKVDGHSFCASKKLIETLGLNRDTPDPSGGKINRDVDGNPTGLLFDNASKLITSKLGITGKEKEFNTAFDHLLANGVTSVRSFGSLDNFIELGRMSQNPDGLPLRVCACVPYEDMIWAFDFGLKTGQGSDTFWVGQIKMFADGSLGSRTALVSKPYPDGTFGLEVMTTREMADVAKAAHEHKLGVAIHTIGDVASSRVARVMKNTNMLDTIEHLQSADPDTIKDVSTTQTPVIANPGHIPLDAEAIYSDWKEIAHMAYPIASMLAAGVPVGFGSDAPVATANPFYAIACATTRKGVSTRQVNPREAISFSAAMDCATSKSAKIIGGPERGRIEEGLMADFILTEDFRGSDPWECVGTKIVATYVSGKQAWPRQP